MKRDGQAMLPVMEYQNISDEDVVAIISDLRSRPPVRREVPPTELDFLGKVLEAFVFGPAEPAGPDNDREAGGAWTMTRREEWTVRP